jgi:DNA-directed RNA polymerase subunit M/transcription elongation factor TFIIS
MLNVSQRIQVITELLEQNTPESVTYAALECRLAIEYLCYDRLKMALDLVSYADLKGWQPGKVMRAVEKLANEDVATSFTLKIAREPDRPAGQELSLEERKQLDYKTIGTQSSINVGKIVALWNALANSALHVQMPKAKSDQLSIHGDKARTAAKVEECLVELRKIGAGTLLSGGFGNEVSIPCMVCEYPIKRRVDRLVDKQTVSCINPECDESYTVEIDGEEVTLNRRVAAFECPKCEAECNVAMNRVARLKVFETASVSCHVCSAPYRIGTRLVFTADEEPR